MKLNASLKIKSCYLKNSTSNNNKKTRTGQKRPRTEGDDGDLELDPPPLFFSSSISRIYSSIYACSLPDEFLK